MKWFNMGRIFGQCSGSARTRNAMENREGADLIGLARWGDSLINAFQGISNSIESATSSHETRYASTLEI